MDTDRLTNTVRFYLRALRRLGTDAEAVEGLVWAQAQDAAERYARWRESAPLAANRPPASDDETHS